MRRDDPSGLDAQMLSAAVPVFSPCRSRIYEGRDLSFKGDIVRDLQIHRTTCTEANMGYAKNLNRDHGIARAAQLIRTAEALVIAAGAGMSVDSGLPAFRGSGGLWTTLMPAGMSERQLGSLTQGDCLTKRPSQAWTFYGRAHDVCRHSVPHDGYQLIREWASTKRHGVFVYTSNVDGHFQAADFSEDRIVECHGTIHTLQCATPCSDRLWPADASIDGLSEPPSCPNCSGIARPNFLLFADDAWIPARTARQQARLRDWAGAIERAVVIEIGAGQAVPSIRLFAETFGAPLIRINLDDEQVEHGTAIGLRGSALAVLKEINAALLKNASLVDASR
ncbi:Sir2 family NAD-dependent protein deacetylase [Caballeronia sp. GACF5]|uniref:SIR2 family NAD-dependent protein deacylase n=1 Tax=Caballeronia sp. GACF5 TaxID=2921746 RepID=UPI002029889C|nr:Sir2 family NAD-dependent protein deacetylase [Caballeronia sp. GACF5]